MWRPWRADDGLLVRIRLLGGALPVAALRRLSEVSRQHADGSVYLTRRANLQLRGLASSAGQLSADVVATIESTGLIPSRTHELARNVLASPQTGLAGGRTDLRPMLQRLDTLLCAERDLARLPGRFLFTLDDGRGDLLDRLTGTGKRGTDLGCVVLSDAAAQLRVGERWGAVLPLDEIAGRMVDLASRFVRVRGTEADAPWHIRELDRPFQPVIAADPRIPVSAPSLAYGKVPGGTHVAAEDGVLTPDLVTSLLDRAADLTHVVVTPWHGVLVPNDPEVSE